MLKSARSLCVSACVRVCVAAVCVCARICVCARDSVWVPSGSIFAHVLRVHACMRVRACVRACACVWND